MPGSFSVPLSYMSRKQCVICACVGATGSECVDLVVSSKQVGGYRGRHDQCTGVVETGEACPTYHVVWDFCAARRLFTNVGVRPVSENWVRFSVVSIQQPVEQRAGATMRSGGGRY